MKHTPGPWSWGDDWRVPDEIGTVYFSDGENPAIKKYMDLELRGPNGTVIPIRIDHYEVIYDGEPIRKADRALIAAAPDLLDAAKMLLASLAWKEKRSGTTYNGADSVRAAIAKAERKED